MRTRTKHRGTRRPLLLILLIGLLIACQMPLAGIDPFPGRASLQSMPSHLGAKQTLRLLADQRGLNIGVAVSGSALKNNPEYARLLSRQFNTLTPENDLKFGPLSPAQGVYDFSQADAILAFAEQHHMQVHGHVLVWTNQLPEWLTQGTWTRQQLLDILHNHIATVVGHYRGRIAAWDVVNEAFTDDGQLAMNNFWMQGIGPDYVELAFRWAHEADPQAMLFYNDFAIEGLGPKSNGVYAMVKDLKQRGVPIDGVGIQAHLTLSASPPPEEVAANLKRYADLGLKVLITEMDVRIQGYAAEDKLAAQAFIYDRMFRSCLNASNCKSFVMWGLTDKHSWIPDHYPGSGAALIFDRDYQPKPAFYSLMRTLANP